MKKQKAVVRALVYYEVCHFDKIPSGKDTTKIAGKMPELLDGSDRVTVAIKKINKLLEKHEG